MIVSVTTLKDSVDNTRKWVRRNLGGGVDHMVVFLDSPQPEMKAMLDEQPHVTAVQTDERWFAGAPTARVTMRQTMNAAMLGRLLSGLPWAKSWGIYLIAMRRIAEGTRAKQDWPTGPAR